MRKYFLSGLALLLPFVVTVWLTMFLVNFLTQPFYNSAVVLLEGSQWGAHFYERLTPELLQGIIKLVILLLLVALTFFIGSVAHNYFGKSLFALSDALMHRIPLLNKIYRASKEVVHSLLGGEERTFGKVVLVPFPHKRAYSIGFLTSQQSEFNTERGDEISVLVPATPNPTQGFMLNYPRHEVIVLDVKVEQALRFIVSCGVMAKDLQQIPPKDESNQ